MEPGNRARAAEIRARLHQLKGSVEMAAVLEAIAVLKAENDTTLHTGAGDDMYRAQGGWSSMDRLETWIRMPTPSVNK